MKISGHCDERKTEPLRLRGGVHMYAPQSLAQNNCVLQLKIVFSERGAKTSVEQSNSHEFICAD